MNTYLSVAEKAARISALQKRSTDTVDAEVRRITAVPVSKPLTKEDYDAVNFHYISDEGRREDYNLMPLQAAALCEYNETGGLFAPIPVGEGKTLITLLIADDCYREVLERMYRKEAEGTVPRVLLLVPPQVIPQLHGDIAQARRLTRFSCPVHFVCGVSKAKRLQIAASQRRGLYITSYSLLSAGGANELLNEISPACILCDEAHNIAGNRSSARSKVFRRYVDAHLPQAAALSGTLTKKSPTDYHYLAKITLGQNNFLPNSYTLTEAWALVLDSNAATLSEMGQVPPTGPIMPLVSWVKEEFPKEKVSDNLLGFRRSLKVRMQSTPGVVISEGSGYGGSLLIENNKIPKETIEKTEGYERMAELLEKLEKPGGWLTPGGDEIEHAMHVWKWRYEIEGAGFYNDLYWPEAETVARRKGCSVREAADFVEKSKESHALHNLYNAELRAFLKDHSIPGLDSPYQVGQDMYRHGAEHVPQGMFMSWKQWKDSIFKEIVERDSRAVRVCPFKINACVDYVKQMRKADRDKGLLVWWHHQAVGAWITEALKEAGIDAVNCIAGAKFNEYLKDSRVLKGKVLCCSVNAHGTGKNLQHGFDSAYYLQWPRDAVQAEQSIGRVHRKGQESDEVQIVTCHSTRFDEVTFSATLNDSAYISQTMGRQKLLYATYNPLPKRVPFAVMQEWGAEPLQGSNESRRLLDNLLNK